MSTVRTKIGRRLVQGASESRAHRRLGVASVQVYEALRQQILDGSLQPGTPLSHRAIAEAMNTSNGPIISALRRLAHDGLISHQHGHGAAVSEFSDEKLLDWLVVRRALETEAARLAARRAAAEDLERLYAIVDRMAEIVRERRWDDADTTDVELHVAIAAISRSPGLIEALGRCHIREVVRRRLLASERRQDFENLEVNHRKLVDAIASGDPDRAGQAMHAHLSRTLRRQTRSENGVGSLLCEAPGGPSRQKTPDPFFAPRRVDEQQ